MSGGSTDRGVVTPPSTALSRPVYLFLDVEWADAKGNELVSLALVSDDGQHTFYAERKKLPTAQSTFVSTVVYPLLERGTVALTDRELCRRLHAFLRAFSSSFVLFDHENDRRLLRRALAACDEDSDEAFPRANPALTMINRNGLLEEYVEEHFAAYPAAAARRHHASVDARVLRAAWLRFTGREDTGPQEGLDPSILIRSFPEHE